MSVALNAAAPRTVGEISPEEYIAFERRGDLRYEYVEGKVIPVAGGSPEHNLIGANTIRDLGKAVETSEANCRIYGSDQKISIDHRRYLYPDVTVVCGNAQFDPQDALQNPAVIVEVLSPSTEREDRTDKFREYQKIESLRHYVLIEQDRPYVTHFEKLAQGLWAIVGEHTDLVESLQLTLEGKTISAPLTALYRNIDFPAGKTDAPPPP